MEKISEWLTTVVGSAPAWAVYTAVFVVLFSETAVLVCGLIMPSEAVLIAAGVAAAIGQPNIFVLIVLAIVGALCGDLTGFLLGRRSGPRVENSWAGRKFGPEYWDGAARRVRRNLFVTVPVGRWLGYVRTVVPITAGMSGVNMRKYALATFIGGATWATSVLVLAYVLGATAGARLIGVLVIGLVVAGCLLVVTRAIRHQLDRRRHDTSEPPARAEPEAAEPEAAAAVTVDARETPAN
ncbi:MAG: DedA family protein [Gordonia sp. (in: high G+C Gram-positive bacteria)]|uniref:DedA family protein n=1 Tax=Gordonia sp. (in: high G+C Gram-positive bacteria) TaxID=84139 RepID=UPI003BB7CC78